MSRAGIPPPAARTAWNGGPPGPGVSELLAHDVEAAVRRAGARVHPAGARADAVRVPPVRPLRPAHPSAPPRRAATRARRP
ncbi:predicted protein [Streptomyces viridosporus ATCC 14672]|uniref:Predicted protein n=1 Tax=Streptomyces viridosporus (strain ATCC 14672 / DSM 40746 / JCM 4963 / KCTC 9882 / NRRL B-12104 / FH 1290) TaxID=566461 RepID=D6A4N1_STRV1|nr:predicted protein [Streptomyces viridosporus ATCC 14672]